MNEYKTLIKNDKLQIVYMDESMYFDVWQNSLDEDIRRFVPDEVFETLEIAKEVVDSLIECYDSKEGPFVFSLIRNEDKANIGYVQLVKINDGWEVGYHIAKKYTGNGYATEGLRLFLSLIKDSKQLDQVYGIALADNLASKRVLIKNGFEIYFEGIDMYHGEQNKIIKSILKFR